MLQNENRLRRLFFTLLIILLFLGFSKHTTSAYPETNSGTVILSSPDDPYYSLAEEISASEKIPLFHTPDDVFEAKPVFLLWVVSPQALSEKVLIDFGKHLKNPNATLSVGIISARNIQDARHLWQGSTRISGADYAIVNGTKPNKIKPEITIRKGVSTANIPLTKTNLLASIKSSDIIQISMEGAPRSWFDQYAGVTVKYSDLPTFSSSIIQNYGCSTFRPWEENSIALECIHQGALAYSGFVYASISGTRFGDYRKISPLYTWEKFPIGHLVQIQNQAAMQSYAAAPHFFMLGDPRLYVSEGMPYTLESDQISGPKRTLRLSGLPEGLIPVVIPNGADYDFVNIPGLTSSFIENPTFNSRIQMIDINRDKYILVDNHQDTLTLELSKTAPLLWGFFNHVLGFLDTTLIQNQDTGLGTYLIVPLLITLLIGFIKKWFTRKDVLSGFMFGSLIATLSLVYILTRLDEVVVTNLPLSLNGLFVFGILVFSTAGQIVYVRSKRSTGKILAILIANLPAFLTLVLFLGSLIVKMLMVGETAMTNKPGYPYIDSAIVFFVGCAFYLTTFTIFKKISQKLGLINRETHPHNHGGTSVEICK